MENFKALLSHIIERPEVRISELPGFASTIVPSPSDLGIKRNVLPGKPASVALTGRPSNAGVELELARIWSEVLGVGTVKPDDNLFDLGGHSLLITRIISRIRKTFGVEVPIYTFFDKPTMGEIARVIESAGARSAADKASLAQD